MVRQPSPDHIGSIDIMKLFIAVLKILYLYFTSNFLSNMGFSISLRARWNGRAQLMRRGFVSSIHIIDDDLTWQRVNREGIAELVS